MGIGITQEHRELARSVRGWLARAVPPEEVRKLLDAPGGGVGRPGYWDGAAEQGILGVHLAEEHGGGGGTILDLAVVLEQTGRAALPGPYLSSVLASAVLAHAGRADLAAALAGGERIAALALGPGTLTATRTQDGYRLDGTAPPVLGGGHADLLVLETPTGWLAVDADVLTVRVHESADPTRPTAEVTAHGVTVPRDRVLDIDTALVRDLARVLFAAEACGVAAKALEIAAEYAKVREQFGRPIGQFQAVKHLCADMLVRVEQARALAWDAARAVDAGAGVRGLVASLAAGTALDAAYGCAKGCIQVLGGIGFTWEHDAHLYLRRALVGRQLLGPGDSHRLRAVRLAAGGARRELRLELLAETETEAERYRSPARTAVEGVGVLDPAAARRALGAYRVRIGALVAEAHALACIGLRTTMQQVSGLEPGAGASVRKLVQTVHQQKTAELALELLGPEGALREGAGERGRARLPHVTLPHHRRRHHAGPAQCRRRAHPRPPTGLNETARN